MASVSMKDVRKSFGEVSVIHGLSLDITDGEFVVLVGPSGCGKSTLLRMIAGLERITAGTVSIGQKVVNDLPPKDRDISMVFQNYALYPHMTVAENMSFSLTIAKTPAEEKRARVKNAAEILGLEPLLDRYPRQLSGGQRQRVAMGRSIVRNPRVFLFDEPLSNLDAKLRVAMRGEIKSLHKRLKTTTIYVTHDQVEAMTMADTIVVMRSGRIEQVGKPLDLYDNPDNLFVAQFIGSPAMNMIEAVRRGGGLLLADGTPIPGIEPPAGLAEGGELLLGKRPEHILPAAGGVAARVRVVEPTGSETQVMVSLAGQELTCVFRNRLEIPEDDALELDLASGPTYFFDKSTGARLR